MAGNRWFGPLIYAALLTGGGVPACAQQAAGSLAGRVTDIYSHPMDGATVIVRNQATGTETRTVTTHNGVYRFANLGPGEYSLIAEAQNLGRGHLEGIVVVAGHEARVQAALEFQPLPPVPPEVAAAEAPQTPPRTPAALLPPVSTRPAPALPLATPAPASPREAPAVEHRAIAVAIPGEPAPAPSTLRPAERPLSAQPLVHAAPVEMTAALLPPALLPPAVLASPSAAPSLLAVRGRAIPAAHPLIAASNASAALRSSGAALARAAALSVRAAQQSAALAAAMQGNSTPLQVATTFTAAQLQAFPLAEGAWEPLILDTLTTAPDDSQEQRSTEGREAAVSIVVDGVTTRLAFGITSTRAHSRSAALIGPGSSVAALREVESATGNTEELSGHGLGGRARAETERGGDRLHGQAFLFDRQNVWGAQNPFTQWVRESAPGTAITVPTFAAEPLTPPDRAALWGLSVGGRADRSRVYWFASVEDRERNDPGVSAVRNATEFFAQPSNDDAQVLAARLGLLSTDPVGEGIRAYFPMLETLDGLLGAAPRTDSRWTGFGRIDSAFRRARLTLEGTGAQWDALGGGLTRASETYGTHSYGASHTSEQWLQARWTAPLAPNLLSVTQGLFGRHDHTTPPGTPSPYEQTLLNVNSWGQLPQIAVDTRYGFTIGNPSRFGAGSYPDEHIHLAQQQFAWTHGKLQLSAGAELSHNTDTTSFLRNQTGSYSYASVENFISDALAFKSFGLDAEAGEHNCDQTGHVWRDSTDMLRGLGPLPCYAHYTQTLGPAEWWLRTNDWAAYATVQRRLGSRLTVSAALRWQREQPPPPIAATANSQLPFAGHMPEFGNEWGPRAGLAWGAAQRRWPVLRLGYGMYFTRTPSAALETALTHTGSPNGDLSYFMRPTDNLSGGGAPPFPYVLAGAPATLVKPAAVAFAPGFRNGEVHQAVASVEQTLPGNIHVEASAAVSLGRRLPLTLDANIDPLTPTQTITYGVVDGNGSGPIKVPQITVPFYASWPGAANGGRLNPNYQQIAETYSGANSTYEAASLQVTRTGRGLTVHARYTYAHALDWNPDDGGLATTPSVFDPANLRDEYGTSDLDIRHSATMALLWGPRWKLDSRGARLFANGWALSSVGSFRSGLPYTMRTAGSLAEEFNASGAAIIGLAPGMNGYGGDNRVYGVGRNTFRYPNTWKADLRLAKRFNLGEMRELEVLAQSFNLFNHQNVTELETIGYSLEPGDPSGRLPTLNFLTGLKANQTEFGQPLNVNATDFYRPRQFEFGLHMRF